VKSTDWFENQPVEFRNNLTIKAVIFERQVCWSFKSTIWFWKLVETLSLVIIGVAAVEDWSWINSWSLILDQFLKLLAWFEAWRKLFVVGKAVLPLRFDLSQALYVCVMVFQVCKRVLAVLVWFLCDSIVFCGVFAYFGSVRVDTL